jgi:hypothetical protein
MLTLFVRTSWRIDPFALLGRIVSGSKSRKRLKAESCLNTFRSFLPFGSITNEFSSSSWTRYILRTHRFML